ncbi:methyltransferase [Paractinoplanes deccanensis]|uniref:Methyltransferase n=1 Tax=Paractinoplanes deccanensis TaxID=113561 RepID=A0ABQ3Y987_9ACTN|nr:class I SAM-dependent methyltransferase [Actinoplanes deccanensis]GID76566.1 methyltransferase [Actinoplanes deccanensis]
MTVDGWLADARASYDTVAESYFELTRDALAGAPFLRAALATFAEMVDGPVADVGCGPGHVTGHLRGLGVDAFGIDLAPAMVEIARREHPGARFEVGSMTDLRLADGSVGGLVAFWSLIHIPDDVLPAVLGHFRRVLRPGGVLLAGFHVGDGSRWKTEGYGGHPMRIHVHRRRPERMAALLRDAGFAITAQTVIGVDEPVPGAMIFAG